MVSEMARSAWAKSYPFGVPDDALEAWKPLWCHLDETMAMAEQVWDHWCPPLIQELVAEAVGSAAHARSLYLWLAANHDIGKLTPAFAVQVPRLAHDMDRSGLPMSDRVFERQRARHELAGQLIVEHWLVDTYGFSRNDARTLAVVIGGHHGSPPSAADLQDVDGVDALMGAGPWRQAQRELLNRQASRVEVDDTLRQLRDKPLPQPVQAMLTGLVIFADWLASNADFFGLSSLGVQPQDDPALRRRDAESCWAEAGFEHRWQPIAPPRDTAAFFARRFPGVGHPRPVQVEAVELAWTMDPHGVLVIEAPMGEGKTEAALMAAEVLAHRSGASGVFIALPTQATANSMFRRTEEWARRLEAGRRTVHLAHGKAWLNEDYDRLLRSPIGIGVDDGTAERTHVADGKRDDGSQITALRWLAGRYRAGLADIVVGTIDQILMTALQAKFAAIRHVALAGKVVVLDEVHAVDVYMSMYLEMALEWLGSYGTPVVLLSATLPASHRRRLLDAYERGAKRRRSPAPARRPSSSNEPPPGFAYVPTRSRASAEPAAEPPSAEDTAYPVLTASASNGGAPERRPMRPSGRSLTVSLEPLSSELDDLSALTALLTDALADGGCALVLRNTVTRVHQTAEHLRSIPELADSVRIAHAQFLAVDRVSLDKRLAADFGPGATLANGQRPARAIVIATQVAEQSLDVDFDLLVTDIAPVDLVLQRLGRVHRHAGRTRPARLAEPRAYLTGFEITDDGPRFPRGLTYVYDEYLLAMSLDALKPRLGGTIELPSDIAPLVRLAYSEGEALPPVVPEWAERIAVLRNEHERRQRAREERAKTFRLRAPEPVGRALTGWVKGGVGSVDESAAGKAQVRDGADSMEVVVACRDIEGLVTIPDWIADPRAGRPVATDLPIERADARALARCTLRLPAAMSVGTTFDRVLAALEQTWFAGWQASPHLKEELVLLLDPDRCASLAGFDVSYSPQQGLKVVKSD